ncbi:MAG: response regulator [bacterium]|nr:response regulator [bacterium]
MTDGERRILIVEDERAMADLLEARFKKLGYDVRVAYAGEAALEYIRAGGHDLIILDLLIPGIDGFKILKTMQTEHIKIPVIVVTNLSEAEQMDEVRLLGAIDAFIKSDIPIRRLIARVQKFFETGK